MADVQQLVQSSEFLARTPAERGQVLKLYQDATPEGQAQILAQLTPGAASQRAQETTGTLQWLPGMECMQLLPESAQRTVAGYLPGLTAAAIQTGAQYGGATLGAATGPFAPVAIPA